MRFWILTVALAAALLPAAAAAAPTPSPTVAAKASPTAVAAKPSATAAAPTPTAAPTQPPKPTAAPTVAPTIAPTIAPTVAPTPAPTAALAQAEKEEPTVAPTSAATAKPIVITRPPDGSVHGYVFYDENADGEAAELEAGILDIEVTLTSQTGLVRITRTAPDGAFGFDGVSPGTYHLTVILPTDHVGTTDAGQDVHVVRGEETAEVAFGLVVPPPDVLRAMRGLPPEDEAPPENAEGLSDEQVMALSSVTSLPLRFAEGRDLMAQIGLRVLGDGLVWLGVPFRSQIDGGDFQFVNCGPASLTMVLAAFGLEVGPSQVRDYLNNLIDNYNTDLGTSLDVLSRIAREAGLTPLDLYSDRGGYRNWSTDAVRWHVQHGRPVITLVKYRNLPGHGQSLSEFDHYIVISGLTPNGFIYNDAAFATTLGYGLEISDVELVYAWENSSIPHHAVALGLDPDKKLLSFPEAPRRAVAPPVADAPVARTSRRLAESDEAERPMLTLVPMPRPSGPLITTSDRYWQDEEADPIAPDDGAPMGLTMDSSQQPALEPTPGIGAFVPKLLVLLLPIWMLWMVWAFSGRLVRWRPTLPPLRAALTGLLGALGLR